MIAKLTAGDLVGLEDDDDDEYITASLVTTPRAPCSIKVSNFTVPGTKCLIRIADWRLFILENVVTGSTVNST